MLIVLEEHIRNVTYLHVSNMYFQKNEIDMDITVSEANIHKKMSIFTNLK